MTRKRTWLALGVLLSAVVVGTVWAADQEPKPTDKPKLRFVCPALPAEPACCAEKCEAKEKSCCEGKCCTAEKGKSCCADGKCCGCCEKGKSSGVSLPILPGSTFELLITPPGGGDAPYPVNWAPECVQPRPCPASWATPVPTMPPAPSVPQTATVPQCLPVTQYVVPQAAQAPLPPPCPYAPPCQSVAVAASWKLHAVVQKDHPCVEMQLTGADDTCAYCDNMVLKVGNEKLKVSTLEKQLQVNCSFLKGNADTVSLSCGNLCFEGHVKLTYEKAGQKAEVSAEHVVIGVADGHLEVKGVGALQQQQVFSFWTGFLQ